jgi:hypothetical protein
MERAQRILKFTVPYDNETNDVNRNFDNETIYIKKAIISFETYCI